MRKNWVPGPQTGRLALDAFELWSTGALIRLGHMNLALFGADEESIALATAAVAHGHQIVWCGDVAWASRQYDFPWLPADDQGDRWESLLDDQLCDAVLVGRGEDAPALRVEQVMVLAKNGIKLLTTFPLVDSVLSYFEIDMARQETDALVRHFNPLTEPQAVVDECARWILAGHPQLGAVEQVTWERPLAERTRDQVLWHFARDVELLNQTAGQINRLGAHGSPDEAATYAGLSVQMLGPRNVPVRWSVGPVEQAERPRLSVIAERGKETVLFDESGRAVQTEINQSGESEATPLEPVDPAASAITRLVEAVQQGSHASTWPEALRAMELVDTIEISLRRGRIIDIHYQQLSEELAFKGTMSAAGCGLLLVLPPLLLLLGCLAGLMGLPVAQYWPHVLLALLAVFLAVQVLSKLLLRKSNKDSSS